MLGRTGINVSRLCFGVLTIGPLQANLPLAEGFRLLKYAVEQGVNFFDTAEIYETYSYLKALLQHFKNEQLIVATKSYAVTGNEMRSSLEKACRELGRDYIDVFLLHEQESSLTLRGHWDAFEFLLRAKEKGSVRAVGISTHNVAGVRAALEVPEIDVIHPLFNIKGLGIKDGLLSEMLAAIEAAYVSGKGIYLMKPLGGGNLINIADKALNFAFSQKSAAAVAVGMQTVEEIEFNVRIATGLPVSNELKDKVIKKKRSLHIESWCEGCGECSRRCPHDALFMGQDGKMEVRQDACIYCGYCASVCPLFCIKVF